MLFCFTDISPEILLHILGCSFCKKHHILVPYLANYLTIKSIRYYLHKSFFAWASKMLVKMTPEMGATTLNIMTFSIITFSIITFSIITFSITTLSITTFSITTFSITTFNITTLSIMTISITINKT